MMRTPLRNLVHFALRFPAPDALKMAADLLLILVAAAWTWLATFGQVAHPGSPAPFIIVVLCARLIIYCALRLHRTSWLHVSRFEAIWLGVSAVLGPPLIAFIYYILPSPFTLRDLVRPDLILATEPAFYLLLLGGARVTARAVALSGLQEPGRRLLIIGAGVTGRALAFQIQEAHTRYSMVGFLDDDERQQGRRVRGLPILGKVSDLTRVVGTHQVQEIAIAMPSLEPARLRQLLAECERVHVPIRILPPLSEILGGQADLKALREVRMEDLLPRPEVAIDQTAIRTYLNGRTVLVTGGGGSIGRELCSQVLLAGASRLLVLGRGENSVFEAIQELADLDSKSELIPVICDVRDRPALDRILRDYKPHVVFHAAAHKHVPLMEQYPCEAVKNNVLGTLNAVQLSVQHRVERFVLVSTDKAVDPSSVMGATKRLGEMIVNAYAARGDADMVSVRFGNVLGSRGSVVPTMTRQILGGQPVTVTDPDMVRYFMTIPEAVQLILQAGAIGGRGEVFVLDMGRPVRILDLARDLIRLAGLVPEQDIPIHIVGRRPGEKVKEDLLTALESKTVEKNGPFYMAPAQAIEFATVMGQVEKLRKASEGGRSDEITSLLQSLLPAFRSQGSNGLSPNGTQHRETAADTDGQKVELQHLTAAGHFNGARSQARQRKRTPDAE